MSKMYLKVIPKGPAIYFLMKDDEVLYVGQTKQCRTRISMHNHAGKFNRVAWTCPKRDLSVVEYHYINALWPPLNTHGKFGKPRPRVQSSAKHAVSKFKTVRLDDVIERVVTYRRIRKARPE